MPQVGIGFYPDVGGTWLLAHAPDRIGEHEHLALTGTTVNACRERWGGVGTSN